jgi:hypothetical protein
MIVIWTAIVLTLVALTGAMTRGARVPVPVRHT